MVKRLRTAPMRTLPVPNTPCISQHNTVFSPKADGEGWSCPSPSSPCHHCCCCCCSPCPMLAWNSAPTTHVLAVWQAVVFAVCRDAPCSPIHCTGSRHTVAYILICCCWMLDVLDVGSMMCRGSFIVEQHQRKYGLRGTDVVMELPKALRLI